MIVEIVKLTKAGERHVMDRTVVTDLSGSKLEDFCNSVLDRLNINRETRSLLFMNEILEASKIFKNERKIEIIALDSVTGDRYLFITQATNTESNEDGRHSYRLNYRIYQNLKYDENARFNHVIINECTIGFIRTKSFALDVENNEYGILEIFFKPENGCPHRLFCFIEAHGDNRYGIEEFEKYLKAIEERFDHIQAYAFEHDEKVRIETKPNGIAMSTVSNMCSATYAFREAISVMLVTD